MKLLRRFAVMGVMALFLLMVPLPQLTFVEEVVASTVDLPPPDEATAEEMAEVQAAADEPLDTPRVQAADEQVEEFSLMAVVFDAPPSEPVMLRVQDTSGSWTEWSELHADGSEGPDNPTNWGTEPFWVGAGQAYELNLDTGDAGVARVVLVRNETRRAVTVQEEVADASTPAPFGINPRSSWNARSARAISYGSTVKKAVVHHTVSGNSYSQGQVPGIIAGIQAYHLDGRGWSDIGYNFLVDKYGGIWEGREGGMTKPVIGAHAAGFNTNTVGISVIGDYTQTSPTAASNEAVARVAGWKLFLGNQEPIATSNFTSGGGPRFPAGTVVNLPNVVGHSDVGSTACPGSVHAALGAIRQRAQEWFVYTREVSGPVGHVDLLATSGSKVESSGWATDLDSDDPTSVRLDVGGRSATAVADTPRPDVQAAFPGYPANTGFRVEATGVPPGFHDACVTAVNQNYGRDNELRCDLIKVADPAGTSPIGAITAINQYPGGFEIGGTVSDPDGTAGAVRIELDGKVVANSARPTPTAWLAKLNGLTAGSKRLCIIAENSNAGVDTRADCRFVQVAGNSPWGNLDSVTVNGRYITLWGWAFDPETPGPTQVNITLDGRHQWPTPASVPRQEIVQYFPWSDNRKGFRFEMNVAPGQHTVCAVAMNTGAGSSQYLGCETVTVK